MKIVDNGDNTHKNIRKISFVVQLLFFGLDNADAVVHLLILLRFQWKLCMEVVIGGGIP